MERLAELVLFLDWSLDNPEFDCQHLRLDPQSVMFCQVSTLEVHRDSFLHMKSEKLLKNITEKLRSAFEHDSLDPRSNTPTIRQTLLLP